MTQAIRSLPKDIKSLTSIRFFAAFGIVLFHFKDHMSFNPDQYTGLIENSYLAVDLFFTLSGFIMAHVYSHKIEDKKFSFKNYMIKRFSRIYPLHIVTLFLFIALGLLFDTFGFQPNVPQKYDYSTIPYNLFIVHAWGLPRYNTFNEPSWSISAEWFAYLLFLPLMLGLLKGRSKPILSYLLSIGFLIGYSLLLPASGIVDKQLTGLASDFGILRILPTFILGITTYFIAERYELKESVSKYLVWGCFAILFILLHFGAPDLVFLPLFSVILFALSVNARHGQNGFLDHPLLVFGGKISYSMYMTHALIYTVYFNGLDILIGKDHGPLIETLIWASAVIGTLPLAIIFYYLIEEPGRAWINRRFLKPSKRSPVLPQTLP